MNWQLCREEFSHTFTTVHLPATVTLHTLFPCQVKGQAMRKLKNEEFYHTSFSLLVELIPRNSYKSSTPISVTMSWGGFVFPSAIPLSVVWWALFKNKRSKVKSSAVLWRTLVVVTPISQEQLVLFKRLTVNLSLITLLYVAFPPPSLERMLVILRDYKVLIGYLRSVDQFGEWLPLICHPSGPPSVLIRGVAWLCYRGNWKSVLIGAVACCRGTGRVCRSCVKCFVPILLSFR